MFLPASENKDKKDHFLPLGETAMRVLRSLSNQGEYCLRGLGDKRQVHHKFNKTVKAAGLPESVRIRDLRHSFLTRIGERERSTFAVQMLGQHSNIQTTERYARSSERAMIQALERLESSGKVVTRRKMRKGPLPS